MHRWVLPVPVPPMKIALRLASRKAPVASSRTCPSSTGCIGEDELVQIFENRELGAADAIADRARLAVRTFGPDQAGDERINLIAPGKTFAGNSHRSWHACRRASVRSWLPESHGVPSGDLPYAVVAATIGHGFDLQAKRIGRGDAGRHCGLSPARQHGQDHIAASDAGIQCFGAGGIDRTQARDRAPRPRPLTN